MALSEEQQLEVEALCSIYEGDPRYKQIDQRTHQYLVGTEGDAGSFTLEVSWPEDYPERPPTLSLDSFYNKHMSPSAKTVALNRLRQQAEAAVGMAMTYDLFDFAKENHLQLMDGHSEEATSQRISPAIPTKVASGNVLGGVAKRSQLTKAQKRRLADRTDHKGELPRGWNWMDVVKADLVRPAGIFGGQSPERAGGARPERSQ
uniref:RWD domain-containing protein 4 isoform X2 n=1 Tax=Myxine glutinosa TaxID=7769 RepID=UPI00358F5E8E